MEQFRAQCPSTDVIVMKYAKFGQMKLGKCIEDDFGHLGCHGDVLDVMDEECSGKRECSVAVGSQEMISRSSCSKSLMQYLDADYQCIKSKGSERDMYLG